MSLGRCPQAHACSCSGFAHWACVLALRPVSEPLRAAASARQLGEYTSVSAPAAALPSGLSAGGAADLTPAPELGQLSSALDPSGNQGQTPSQTGLNDTGRSPCHASPGPRALVDASIERSRPESPSVPSFWFAVRSRAGLPCGDRGTCSEGRFFEAEPEPPPQAMLPAPGALRLDVCAPVNSYSSCKTYPMSPPQGSLPWLPLARVAEDGPPLPSGHPPSISALLTSLHSARGNLG